jgi:ribonuclease P protein subunit POP4
VPLPSDNANHEDGDKMEDTNDGAKAEEKDKEERKPLVFELHGNQFEMRAADRANKKFKWKGMEYI